MNMEKKTQEELKSQHEGYINGQKAALIKILKHVHMVEKRKFAREKYNNMEVYDLEGLICAQITAYHGLVKRGKIQNQRLQALIDNQAQIVMSFFGAIKDKPTIDNS